MATSLRQRLAVTRQFTEVLCEPLSAEDCVVQSMPDVSPTRWHLAHTTWFFETFVLARMPGYEPFDCRFEYLFNSYYNAVGDQFPRLQRGLLTRPGLEEVKSYRRHVDRHLLERLESCDSPEVTGVVELGIHHEQQHQELILTDIKHVLSRNPLFPVYREGKAEPATEARPLRWTEFTEGIREVGHEGNGFAFDNELPRHRRFVESFQLANRRVNCGEYLQFMEDGGYRRPELWLSLGWQKVCDEQWQAPLYWHSIDGYWHQFTLAGLKPVQPAEPVCHVSYFEADAFARWSNARLPTEAEWEVAAGDVPAAGNFADTLLSSGAAIHPSPPTTNDERSLQLFGDVWQWTASPYTPYPGYRPPDGALGEYNGKFMCNQYVLRGGSCATSRSHIRRTYRNFFPPEARWQFSGLRLAR